MESFEDEPLTDDVCPVCHGLLTKQESGSWCPTCDLNFAP